MGKGSNRRPRFVPFDEFAKNYERSLPQPVKVPEAEPPVDPPVDADAQVSRLVNSENADG